MAPAKRYTLAATLIELQYARVLDDLTEMFIKRMMRIHRLGREALALDRLKHQERTDRLVHSLHEVILAWNGEGSSEQRLEAILMEAGYRVRPVIACGAMREPKSIKTHWKQEGSWLIS